MSFLFCYFVLNLWSFFVKRYRVLYTVALYKKNYYFYFYYYIIIVVVLIIIITIIIINMIGDTGTSDALDYFTDSLAKFTKFSGFRCLATLSYASDIYNGSSIVSR